MKLRQTPSQTVGPFFAFSLSAPQYGYALDAIASGEIADQSVPGERIEIFGQVLDGAGVPIDDAMIEVWHADSEGRYARPSEPRTSNRSFTGFGRFGTGTEAENRFVFRTIKPGSVDGEQAPHLNVMVFMRGMLTHAYTRCYFSDEVEANARDPFLTGVPEDRRATLIAIREEASSAPRYRFDIRMQGDDETVFFDV